MFNLFGVFTFGIFFPFLWITMPKIDAHTERRITNNANGMNDDGFFLPIFFFLYFFYSWCSHLNERCNPLYARANQKTERQRKRISSVWCLEFGELKAFTLFDKIKKMVKNINMSATYIPNRFIWCVWLNRFAFAIKNHS